MNPWFAKAAVLATLVGYSFIRAPHGRRSRSVRVAEDRKSLPDILLLIGAALGTTLRSICAKADALHVDECIPFGLGTVGDERRYTRESR